MHPSGFTQKKRKQIELFALKWSFVIITLQKNSFLTFDERKIERFKGDWTRPLEASAARRRRTAAVHPGSSPSASRKVFQSIVCAISHDHSAMDESGFAIHGTGISFWLQVTFGHLLAKICKVIFSGFYIQCVFRDKFDQIRFAKNLSAWLINAVHKAGALNCVLCLFKDGSVYKNDECLHKKW